MTWFTDRCGPFSCIPRSGRNARTVLSALPIRSTTCIARRRSITDKVTRERIVLKNCESLSTHNTDPIAEILILQM